MTLTHRLYRLTHRSVQRVDPSTHGASSLDTSLVTLNNLTQFAASVFSREFEVMKSGTAADVAKTCNVPEWERRIYHGAQDETIGRALDFDISDLPPKHSSIAGQAYATTTEIQDKEELSSFVLVHHKATIPEIGPAPGSSTTNLSGRIQSLINAQGVTHIWLGGTGESFRHQGHMKTCFRALEQDTKQWRMEGRGSGIITAHSFPARSPAMIQFLLANNFKGGYPVLADPGKLLYWKEL